MYDDDEKGRAKEDVKEPVDIRHLGVEVPVVLRDRDSRQGDGHELGKGKE